MIAFDPISELLLAALLVTRLLARRTDPPETAAAIPPPSTLEPVGPVEGRAIVRKTEGGYEVVKRLSESRICEETKLALASGPDIGIRWEHPGSPVEWGQ